MKLRFTPRSLTDISDIADYVKARDPRASQRVRHAIYSTLQLLIAFPNLGRQQAAKDVRKVVTRRYVYLVYYRVDETADEVVILSVRHPAQSREYSDR